MPVYQPSLLAVGEPAVDADAQVERVHLDDHAWVDVVRGFLRGTDTLMGELVERVDWQQGRRWMYERVVDDPRLSRWFPAGCALPHPLLAEARHALEGRYGVAFGAVGLNYYRDGNDSVAFHRDRELRDVDDALVAIATLGSTRPFLIRPRGRGASRDFSPGPGDLLVMGGSCQRDWEHAVPKVKRGGPRLSLSWRWSAERGPVLERPPDRRRSAPRASHPAPSAIASREAPPVASPSAHE